MGLMKRDYSGPERSSLGSSRDPNAPVPVIAFLQEDIDRQVDQTAQVRFESLFYRVAGLERITVRTAERFRNDLVQETQFFEILGSHFERFGGFRRFRGVIPQDGGAAL